MGRYLNPGNTLFRKALNSQIYVDKSELISYTNRVINSEQQYVCVSRPRRFGKSMAANMLAAYYSREIDSKNLFKGLKIEQDASFEKHLNQYNVIFLNMQKFLSKTHDVSKMEKLLETYLLQDLFDRYPDIKYLDKTDLTEVLLDIYMQTEIPFVFIIDEWDCIFRENKNDVNAQKLYLDFLRNLLKDAEYVALAYMTGILPIKKYGSHSALNMFDEFSMTNPKQLTEFVGFTESEVQALCIQYDMDFEETRRWYDGYSFENLEHVYSPRSVVSAMLSKTFDNFWNQTETFGALKDYIAMNYAGLKDTIIELLAGKHKKIDISSFSNDMTTFSSADDVLTLLVHLGYLGYDYSIEEVFIPNSEVASVFVTAVKNVGWQEVINAVKKSDSLLNETWNKHADAVAQGIEDVHFETSILKYKNKNRLVISTNLTRILLVD